MTDDVRESSSEGATDEAPLVPARVKVALALSGGGGRGLAHVGVLKVLEREGIELDLITGTSIGAVIGGIYASDPDAAALQETVLRFIRERDMEGLNLRLIRRIGDVSRVDGGAGDEELGGDDRGVLDRLQHRVRQLYASHRALSRIALLEGGQLLEALESLFEGRRFHDVEIPFAAVAVDMNAGCEVIITRGSLARGIAASAAMAGIFPPVTISGRELIDGGYTSPVPIEAAETLGANVVLAVDVSLAERNADRFANAVEVGIRAGEISRVALEREQLRRADVVIPARMEGRHWSDFSAAEEAIARGERSAENMLDSIRSVIGERARLFV